MNGPNDNELLAMCLNAMRWLVDDAEAVQVLNDLKERLA